MQDWFSGHDVETAIALYLFACSCALFVAGMLVGYLLGRSRTLASSRQPLRTLPPSSSESGNVFFTLFGAVAMVGVLGAAGMSVMKGPVRSMHLVTQRTIAENNMIASAKLAIISAAQQGDCDGDGTIEPIAWINTGTGPRPVGGGYLPASIGASLQDPWTSSYGYCVWDHGGAVRKTTPAPTCPTPADRLSGAAAADGPVIAVLSPGPDRVYQTSCGDGPAYITKTPGSDDIVLMHTYAEASALAAGLWTLKPADPNIAEIKKDLEVKNAASAVVMKVDSTSDAGRPSIKVDYVKALANSAVEFLSNVELGSIWLSGDGGNEGIRIDAAGKVGVGTATPEVALSVLGSGSGAAPATSGTLDNTVNLRVARGSVGVDIGMMDSGVGYVQSRASGNLANNFGLSLQPNGGGVGIGTTSPIGRFHVRATANQNVFVGTNTNGADTGAVGLAAINDTNTAYAPLGFIASRFSFNTGSVGIGTLSPAQKLDVAGGIRSTAYNYINMADPTVVLQDTDHRSAALHTNANAFYLLTGSGVNGASFAINGGSWPLAIDLNSDTITLGGPVSLAEGNLNLNWNAVTGANGTIIDGGGGWLRTYGQTGWYSQTYGGGWYMLDTNWIRAYNDKNIYTGGVVRGDSGVHTNQICNISGGGCVAQSALGGGISETEIRTCNALNGCTVTCRSGWQRTGCNGQGYGTPYPSGTKDCTCPQAGTGNSWTCMAICAR